MPYVVEQRGEKWACVNPDTGRVYGTHDTEEKAKAQQRALYANAPPEREDAAESAFIEGELEARKEPEDTRCDACKRKDAKGDDRCDACKRIDACRKDGTSEGAKKAWDSRGRAAENAHTREEHEAAAGYHREAAAGDVRGLHAVAARHHEGAATMARMAAEQPGLAGQAREASESARHSSSEAHAGAPAWMTALQHPTPYRTVGRPHSPEETEGHDPGPPRRRDSENHGYPYVIVDGPAAEEAAEETDEPCSCGGAEGEARCDACRRKAKQGDAKVKRDAAHPVARFDILERLDGAQLDPLTGFLRADAHIARTGIQIYRRGDGKVRKELRLPEDVFHADTLASFSMAPVTDDHPPDGLLTSENVRKYQRGHLGESVHQDGPKVRAKLLITDADLVQKVLAGKTQLSCGYVCDLDETPGEYEGERYDAVQRAIRGNHVAVVDRARGGPELRLKLDSEDAVSIRADREPDGPHDAPSTAQESTQMTVKMNVDGIEVEAVNEQGAQLIGRALQARDQRADAAEKAVKAAREDAEKQIAQLNSEKEQVRARATVAETKVTELEKARKDAEDALPNLVKERVALLEEARAVAGAEAKFDNLDALAIKRVVIARLAPEVKLDGESADFVNGIYTATLAGHKKRLASGGLAAARALDRPRGDATDEIPDAEAARRKMREDSEKAWQQPLSAAKA